MLVWPGSAWGDAHSACSRRRGDHSGVLSGRGGGCSTSSSSPPSGTVRWVRGSSGHGSGAAAPVGGPSGSRLLVPSTADALSLRAALPGATLPSVSLRASAGSIRTEPQPAPCPSDVLGGVLRPQSPGSALTRSGAVSFRARSGGWELEAVLLQSSVRRSAGRREAGLVPRRPGEALPGGRHRMDPGVFGGQPSGWHRRPGGCSLSAVEAGRLPLEEARPGREHSEGDWPMCGSFGGASEAPPVRLRRPDARRGSFSPRGRCWAERPSESALEGGS